MDSLHVLRFPFSGLLENTVAEIIIEKEQNNLEVFFTQKELAERWRVTEATIKNIRDSGGISYFFPPKSSRVLYPIEEVIRIEVEQLVLSQKEDNTLKQQYESKMKKPVVSSNSDKKWEI